jgi:hypothetical protein
MTDDKLRAAMTDPNQLTPADVHTLTGEDLNRAVEWWVYGDDLKLNDNDSLRWHVASYLLMRREGMTFLVAHKQLPGEMSFQVIGEDGTPTANRGKALDCVIANCPYEAWRSGWQETYAALCRDPRPFETDANLCLKFWERDGVLAGRYMAPPTFATDEDGECDDVWYITGGTGYRIRDTVWDKSLKIAACRAAVLECMRRKV